MQLYKKQVLLHFRYRFAVLWHTYGRRVYGQVAFYSRLSNEKKWGNMGKLNDAALYDEMCRVVGKVVLEMRDLGQEPKHIVIAGVVRTMLANQRIKRTELTEAAMEEVIRALGFDA